MARGQQLIHDSQLALIPHFFVEPLNDGLVLLGHGIPPSDALIRYLWRSALPSGTALRKPGTARLEQAYSPALCRAIPMDVLSIPCSARRNPRRPAAFLFSWGRIFPSPGRRPHLTSSLASRAAVSSAYRSLY